MLLSKNLMLKLTVSGQWPQHHSGHSLQTAGCADPGPHSNLLGDLVPKLEKKEKSESKKKNRLGAEEDANRKNQGKVIV